MYLESVTFCTSVNKDKRKGSESRTRCFYLAFTTFQTSQQKTLTKVVLIKRVKIICSSLREYKKKNFLSFRIYSSSSYTTISINAILRRRIFVIHQRFFKIFHKSKILVELVETMQNLKKKKISHFNVQVAISSLPQLSWVVTGSPSLKKHFKNFLNTCLHITEPTNKQTNIGIHVWNQHTKNFCMSAFC